jgi:purine nucleosidase
MNVSRPSIIIDTDPGQDDAVAILLALAERDRLDVRGITTVSGNVALDKTTVNALKIVELSGRIDVPVHPGARQPLVREEWRNAEPVCGADGLAGADLPAPRIAANAKHAVPFMIETLTAAADRSITLCALGPLTNLALAFAQSPDLASKVERIVLMGGARDLGNITPAAEFNFYVDPHAAARVFRLGVPIVMFGLHVTHQAIGTPERLAPMKELGTPVGHAVHGMLSRPRPGGIERFGGPGHPLHDPCVIAWLLWPELFAGRDCHVAIECSSAELLGRSTIDWWNVQKRPPNALVIDRIDADRYFERLTASLAMLT